MGAIPWEATSHEVWSETTKNGPEDPGELPRANRHRIKLASLKEYGSFIDQGKWKLQLVNKYQESSFMSHNHWLGSGTYEQVSFLSIKIITKDSQTEESKN